MKDNEWRAQEILRILDKAYPEAPKTYLNYRNNFEMTIATILSARATDACVNKVTPDLFRKYPTPKALMNGRLKDISEIIRPCGAYSRKSEFIREASRQILERFSGHVPSTMDELVTLPGVSRKTANVILSVVFDINEGVVVDTHIMRVTQRLDLTSEKKNRNKIERELMNLLPDDLWGEYARLIGAHGRRTCSARKPKCIMCSISKFCPSAELFMD